MNIFVFILILILFIKWFSGVYDINKDQHIMVWPKSWKVFLLQYLFLLSRPLLKVDNGLFCVYQIIQLRDCVMAWSNSNKLFLIQNIYVRMISNSSYRASCTPLFVGHTILTLPCLYTLQLLTNVRSRIDLFWKL